MDIVIELIKAVVWILSWCVIFFALMVAFMANGGRGVQPKGDAGPPPRPNGKIVAMKPEKETE